MQSTSDDAKKPVQPAPRRVEPASGSKPVSPENVSAGESVPPPPVPPPPPAPPEKSEKRASWLLAKEIPYALTLILAALGWCIVQAVSAIKESPSVSYAKNMNKRPDGNYDVSFRVKNISRSHLFRRVSFYISVQNGTLSQEWVDPMPPAKVVADDNIRPAPEPIQQGVKMVRFYVAQLQPEASWDFHAVLANTAQPDPQLLMDFSSIGTSPNVTVEPASLRLIPEGRETWLVENEVKLLLISCAVWFILAVFYICCLIFATR